MCVVKECYLQWWQTRKCKAYGAIFLLSEDCMLFSAMVGMPVAQEEKLLFMIQC